jgi:hypothetical protein
MSSTYSSRTRAEARRSSESAEKQRRASLAEPDAFIRTSLNEAGDVNEKDSNTQAPNGTRKLFLSKVDIACDRPNSESSRYSASIEKVSAQLWDKLVHQVDRAAAGVRGYAQPRGKNKGKKSQTRLLQLPNLMPTTTATPLDPVGDKWLEEIKTQINNITDPLYSSNSRRKPKDQLTEINCKIDLATTMLIRGVFLSRSQVIAKMQDLEARERHVNTAKVELEQQQKQLVFNMEELKEIQAGVAEMSRMATFEQQSVNGQQDRIWQRDRELRRQDADFQARMTEQKSTGLKLKSQKAEIKWMEVRLKGRRDTLRRKGEIVTALIGVLKEKEVLLNAFRGQLVEYKDALQGRYEERERVYKEFLTVEQLGEIEKRLADTDRLEDDDT